MTFHQLKLGIFEHFIDQKDYDMLLLYARRATPLFEHYTSADPFWAHRVINIFDSKTVPEFIQDAAWRYLEKVKEAVMHFYGLEEEIYADTMQFVKWEKNTQQSPHADAWSTPETLNEYPWREFGSILYLNSEYEGGSIYYPYKGVTYKPGGNSLAFHPGSWEYSHGVRQVTKGTRYTMASFWTSDKEKRLHEYRRRE